MLAPAREAEANTLTSPRAWKACPMNVSAACPQCGAIANPNDKFCNTCGTPLQRPGQAGPQQVPPAAPQGQPPYAQQPAPQYAAQPAFAQQPQQGYPPPQPYGAPAPRPARCQLGHDIMPGMSYCAQGHQIALDAMQFANDPNAAYAQQPPPQGYGAPPPGYGGPPQGGPPPYDPRQPPPPAPAQGLGFGGPQAYPPPPMQQGYGVPGQGGYPGAQQPVFQPAAVPPPGQYAPPPGPPPGYPTDTAPERLPAGAKLLRGFLVSFQSNPAGDFWPLSTGRVTIGRANAPEPADVPLADATISSRHAALNIDANAIVVEDTSSTNGTYVNEEHIGPNGRRELRDGDRLRFGGFTTIVKILGRS
jgi:hypothetical protein